MTAGLDSPRASLYEADEMNEAQDRGQLPAGTVGAGPAYLRTERTSSLAVSWRGLLLATLLFVCLAALLDFVL